ncbi:uncharacterized protein LOC143915352 [Arctopsyche grandis]|uniref:uncharacterized protein LOC143915352 n=1 Tax=Arctopsyche grandis TaxID=121162 RepID=UPI00406D9C56
MASGDTEECVLIVGGIDDQAGLIEIYNLKTKRWSIFYNLGKKMKSFTSVVLDHNLFLLGGYYDNEVTNKVWCLDLNTKFLIEKNPPMNQKRQFATASVVDNVIYVIGGVDSDQKALDTVEKWNSATKTWDVVKSMRNKRFNHAAVSNNSEIIVIGGENDYMELNQVEIYCTETNDWREANPIDPYRSNLAAVSLTNKIYAIGGSSDVSTTDLLQQFDIGKNYWDNGLKKLPKTLAAHSAVVYQNNIICFGDENSKSILQYNPITPREWINIGDMPSNRRYYNALVANIKCNEENSKVNDVNERDESMPCNINRSESLDVTSTEYTEIHFQLDSEKASTSKEQSENTLESNNEQQKSNEVNDNVSTNTDTRRHTPGFVRDIEKGSKQISSVFNDGVSNIKRVYKKF